MLVISLFLSHTYDTCVVKTKKYFFWLGAQGSRAEDAVNQSGGELTQKRQTRDQAPQRLEEADLQRQLDGEEDAEGDAVKRRYGAEHEHVLRERRPHLAVSPLLMV